MRDPNFAVSFIAFCALLWLVDWFIAFTATRGLLFAVKLLAFVLGILLLFGLLFIRIG